MPISEPNKFENLSATTCRLSRDPPILSQRLVDTIQFQQLSDSHITRKDGGLRQHGNSKQLANNLPLITVITVVYNNDKYLEQTIKSIIEQTYDAVEYIVIDGGSTDQTLEIIKRYDNAIDYWLSEPDKGIADAMNKGLRYAAGRYILFIHGDDYLANTEIFEKTVKLLESEDIAMFDIFFGSDLKRLTPRGFNFWMNFKTGVYHQGALCKREVFDKIGYFDTGLKIAMDYDFFLRAYRNGLTARHYPFVLSVMRDTGISSQTDWPTLQTRFGEEKKVHLKYCSSFFMLLIYRFYWWFYLNYRKIRYWWNNVLN